MKKTFLILIVLSLLSTLFACGGNGGKNKSNEEDSNMTAEYKFLAWTTHSYDKIIANASVKDVEAVTDYTVYLTRGETESVQLVIRAEEAIKKVTFACLEGENDSIAASYYLLEKTHEIKRREYTDSMTPYYGKRFVVPDNQTFPIFVDFKTTSETPAGDYRYVYAILDENEKVVQTYNITVHVWDIVLPEEKTFATAVNISTGWIESFGYRGEEMYKQFYNILLENNMSAYNLPVGILTEEADAYMSDPRITSFIVPCNGKTDEEIIAYYEKIKSNPDWLRKALFYPIDEPRNEEHLDEYEAWCKKLKALAPEIPVIAPFYTNIKTGTNLDQVDDMAPHTDLWCPKLCLWDDDRSYGDYKINWQEKSFADRMTEFQNQGDRMWTYVCNDPIDPYAQLFADTEGVVQRLMFWQMYQRDIEGFLYWSSSSWGYHGEKRNPWTSLHNGVNDGYGSPVYGEGILFYPGSKVGVGGPVASVRQKYIRDGIDDIELFYLAENILGKEWVMDKVNYATPDLKTYISDDEFAALRIEIGNAVEEALKNK